ncbi:MAG: phenylalanine--tRNA ligase subunit beta [Akkermansia sp.]
MKISLNWLSRYLDIDGLCIDEMSDMLTFAGIEVEDIQQQGVDSPFVVVAQVVAAEKHPEADRLKVCQVDVGDGRLRQIVCGAQNYKVGDKVPCALPGAVLPGHVEIKVGKLRGVESLGMLCSASELGFPDKEHGLWILPQELVLGTPIAQVVDTDTIIEVEVTPNRPDLLCHWGMARELSAITERSLKQDPSIKPPTSEAGDFVRLEHPEVCPFYTAMKIAGVTVKESPEWLKKCLVAVGLRPINNVVDVTNFVMMELGQPLHAFDAARVEGGLVVRAAHEGETFSALVGGDYRLRPCDLVIADQSGKALALGGVMGGADSGVTESTTDVILESAWFKPSAVRATSRQLAISSDSSYRFERGCSPWNVLRSAGRAAALIEELTGGKLSPALVAGKAPTMYAEDVVNGAGTVFSSQGTDCEVTHLLHTVALNWRALDQMTSSAIPHDQGAAILTGLGLESPDNDGTWVIPPWRLDLGRECDLLEEIVRVYGLDNLPSRYSGPFAEASTCDAAYDYQMSLRRQLVSLGFYETQTIKLIASESGDGTIAQVKDAMPLKPLLDGDLIRVSLPLSEDHSVMRPAHTPGLIAAAVRNVNQGATSLRFFELGRVFRNTGGGKGKDIEQDTLGILISGDLSPRSWKNTHPETASDEDLVAVVQNLLPGKAIKLNPAKTRLAAAYGADIQVEGKPCGYFARLSLARCRELGLVKPVYVVELDLRKMQEIGTAPIKAVELPQFPGSSRDAAMEIPVTTPNADIEKAIASAGQKLLVDYACFDLFADPTGVKMPADRKSLAYSFMYRANDKTLTAAEVDAAHKSVIDHLAKRINGLSFR